VANSIWFGLTRPGQPPPPGRSKSIIKGLFSATVPIRVVLNQTHVDPSPVPHGFARLGLALVILVLVPLSTVVLAPWLLRARHSAKQQLRPIDYLALAVGAAPFAFVGGIYLVSFLTR
jgi:hypothetical protein